MSNGPQLQTGEEVYGNETIGVGEDRRVETKRQNNCIARERDRRKGWNDKILEKWNWQVSTGCEAVDEAIDR